MAIFLKSMRQNESKRSLYHSDGAMDPNGLCMVHCTEYLPEISSKNTVYIKTSNTATDGTLPRNTVHTTLNHRVQSHEGGNWDQKAYLIIGDFTEVMEANGVPRILNTVDTYWALPEKTGTLEIPNATLLHPNSESNGRSPLCLYVYDDDHLREVRYKTKDFTLADYATLTDHKSSQHVECMIGKKDITQNDMLEAAKLNPNMEIKSFLESHVEPDNTFEAEDAGLYTRVLRRQLTKANIAHASNQAIEERGYSVQPGGEFAWGERRDVDRDTQALAKKLGTNTFLHSQTAEMHAEQALYNLEALSELYKRGEKGIKDGPPVITSKYTNMWYPTIAEGNWSRLKEMAESDDPGFLSDMPEVSRQLILNKLQELEPTFDKIKTEWPEYVSAIEHLEKEHDATLSPDEDENTVSTPTATAHLGFAAKHSKAKKCGKTFAECVRSAESMSERMPDSKTKNRLSAVIKKNQPQER